MNKTRTLFHSFSWQIRLVYTIISVITFNAGYAQMPMMPFPMGKGGGPVLDTGVQKVLIAENCKTGKTDTITQGSYIKLWAWLPQARNKIQPLMRIDFDKHTFYYESTIVSISDSNIVLVGKPVISLPLPLPFLRKKILLDTIPLSAITSFRYFDKNSQMALTNSFMMPAMSFMPEEFTTFPTMLFMMPANGIVLSAIGSSFYPMRKIKKDVPKYRLFAGEKRIDTIYSSVGLIYRTDMPYEWEIDKYQRWQQAYTRANRILGDRIFLENTGNRISSISLGYMFFPGFTRGPEDTKTHINIPDKGFVIGYSSERYISQKDRVGMELQFSSAPKYTSVTTNRISAGFGSIFSITTFFKIGLGGMYGKSKRALLFNRWAWINPDTLDSKVQAYRAIQRLKQIAEPQFYFYIGGGAINTTILKMKGSVSNMNFSTTDYSQKKFSLQTGFGASSRVGQRLLYDMVVKYIWSPNYRPSIGGLKSYSGFKLQCNIGYVYGPSFAKKRRMLASLAEKIK